MNVLKLVKIEISLESTEFDNNIFLINCPNGIYNLENDKFIPHGDGQYFKKMSGAEYLLNANCPEWIKFVNDTFCNDLELIRFIQIFCGSCLSGVTDQQSFYFAYGSGANGKSTFSKALKMLLKDYLTTIPVETLLYQRIEINKSESNLAKMYGARLVIPSEIPKNCRLNERLIKDITGGEDINARHIYGKPFNYKPTFKLLILGNSKPNVMDSSHGFW